MNVNDAAYHTVHDCDGGAAALAARLIRIDSDGNRKPMSEAVLNSKVNPNTSTHHLTLAEANTIMGLTGDHRILHALAAQHGYVLQATSAKTTGSLICSLLASGEASGDLQGRVREAMEDGVITGNEAAAINRACAQVMETIARVAQNANAQAGVADIGRVA